MRTNNLCLLPGDGVHLLIRRLHLLGHIPQTAIVAAPSHLQPPRGLVHPEQGNGADLHPGSISGRSSAHGNHARLHQRSKLLVRKSRHKIGTRHENRLTTTGGCRLAALQGEKPQKAFARSAQDRPSAFEENTDLRESLTCTDRDGKLKLSQGALRGCRCRRRPCAAGVPSWGSPC